jgi:hypothetical protein
MNAIPSEGRQESWESYGDGFTDELPQRPRRRFLTPWSALLFAIVVGAVGFYVGIRVEKGQLASSSGTSGLASALASRFGVAAGASSTVARTGGAAGVSGLAGRGGLAGFAGFGGAGGSTIGTVSSVNGSTLYVTETSGDTVKVRLSSATKITKDESVSRSKVYPGDSVVIGGVAASKGTISATTLTDSGVRFTGSTASGSSSSSGNSAVSSLFGG